MSLLVVPFRQVEIDKALFSIRPHCYLPFLCIKKPGIVKDKCTSRAQAYLERKSWAKYVQSNACGYTELSPQTVERSILRCNPSKA